MEKNIKVTYRRKSSDDDDVDFSTATFPNSSSSDEVYAKKNPSMYNSLRNAKCKRLSGMSDLKVTPASCRPREHSSERVPDTTSVLRRPLSNILFDHYFQNIWKNSPVEKRKTCAYLSCFVFYMYSLEHNRERVLSWIKKENIFLKKYVFIPILLWSHWNLLILCHFGERNPCILLLDSLHKLNPLRLEPLIRRLVLDIYETENRPEDKDVITQIPLLVPKVPQQRNGRECGIFALYYVNLFLESAPKNFNCWTKGYPYFLKEDWFTEEDLEGFYTRLELIGTESSDSESEEGSDSEVVGDAAPLNDDGPATPVTPNDRSEAQLERRRKRPSLTPKWLKDYLFAYKL